MSYRILQVGSFPNWAGTERHVLDVSVGLAQRGHKVSLACPVGSVLDEKANRLGLERIPVHVRNESDWSALPTFVRTIRQGYEIVHTHAQADYLVVGIAARLARVPALVMTRHLPHPFASKRKGYMCSLLYHRMIAVSYYVREVMVRSGVPQSTIEVILNGIAPSAPHVDAHTRIREEFRIPPDAILVGAAGRITPEKGFDVLLNALAVLKQWGNAVHCIIFGEGRWLNDLRLRAAQLGIAGFVHLPGFRTHMAELWDGADIAVVPSVRPESFGFTLLEALAAACPAIASRVGGIPEVASSACTLLTEPGDVNGLAVAIEKLALSPELRRQMKLAATQRAKQFTLAATVDGIERVYDSLLASRA